MFPDISCGTVWRNNQSNMSTCTLTTYKHLNPYTHRIFDVEDEA